MAEISIVTKKINDLTAADLVGSDSDVIIIRMNDGSGVKKLTIGSLRKAMSGDISLLQTDDKSSAVAALNELCVAEKASSELIAPLVYPNAGSHNGVFRGKDISASVNDGSFYQNIKNGSFKDIYIGDHFSKKVNGTAYDFRIAGLNIYLHRGDTEFVSNHAVVVPDSTFGQYKMNDTNTTAGGYVGSKMYTSVLPLWAGYLATAFGSNLLTNRELLTNAISGELPSSWSWYGSKVNLMSEEETTGCPGFGLSGFNTGYNVGIAYGQLPLFRLAPEFICNRNVYWLKDITCSTSFADVGSGGDLGGSDASSSWYLRPRFLLG
ncbi:MAG: hypothetical protein LKF53_02675 [Solobacterium sp.]|jgi:hypothetical protein|nr:hypothetical protein [Solobacterium sp.]MCH4205283.1 hypothetical protein [Solobacterium sp.]MCH4226876.1 hypothetical protein [Solobacterium sp.]MCH4281636.1 hypothetical protein [Solobacterium sp.]